MKERISIAEAIALTGRSRRTIYNWIEWNVLHLENGLLDTRQVLEVEARMTAHRGRPRKNVAQVAA